MKSVNLKVSGEIPGRQLTATPTIFFSLNYFLSKKKKVLSFQRRIISHFVPAMKQSLQRKIKSAVPVADELI